MQCDVLMKAATGLAGACSTWRIVVEAAAAVSSVTAVSTEYKAAEGSHRACSAKSVGSKPFMLQRAWAVGPWRMKDSLCGACAALCWCGVRSAMAEQLGQSAPWAKLCSSVLLQQEQVQASVDPRACGPAVS